LELLLNGKVDIAGLEVMVINLDNTGERARLRVNFPRCLPLAAPECLEVRIDAADVDLQISVLVKAQACSCCALFVVLSYVCIDRSLDSGLVCCPLVVELFREVAFASKNSCLHRVRVK